jgi:hypothetical protein
MLYQHYYYYSNNKRYKLDLKEKLKTLTKGQEKHKKPKEKGPN